LKLYHSRIKTPIGMLYLGRTEKGLKLIALDKEEWEKQLFRLGRKQALKFERDESKFSRLKQQLRKYFSEKKPILKFTLDWDGASDFQKKVWQAIKKIPYGETRSYKWIAQKIRVRSYRAVGQACGSNPLPILIPCHRVIASDGGLGGFGGGLKTKIKLLRLERAI
jgi:methylated-DNA-[protein]-cysteine S-methyltransferase